MKINETLQFQNVGLPEDILRMKHHGDYDNEIKLIDIRLQDENLPQCLRQLFSGFRIDAVTVKQVACQQHKIHAVVIYVI